MDKPPMDKKKVLVVEDSELQAELLRRILTDAGHDVTLGKNGKEGLEILRSERPTLIISDILMPVMDGYIMCRAVKDNKNLKDIPVMLLTVLTDAEDIIKGLEAGADYFVTKPFDPEYLVQKIKSLLEGQIRLVQERKFIEIEYTGKYYKIHSDPEQILKLLLSTYENAVLQNKKLNQLQVELKLLNETLEEKVKERTAELMVEISERKKTEQELKETLDELKLSNADLQQFAYVASHDLSESLRMVSSYVQLLSHKYRDKLDEEANQYIDFAVQGVVHLRAMLDSLLEYSRIETGHESFKPTSCEDILTGVLNSLNVFIQENKVEITHDALPTILADGAQISRVFQNLISNSIKFRKEEPPRIHISAVEREQDWLFSVRDNGIGIDPQFKDRIFTLFQRLQGKKYPGTGIGLTLSKRIVERHGGRIWVESELGKGATFYFTIWKL